MDFKEYAQASQETAIYPDELPDHVNASIIYTAMGLSDEAGEVLGKIKKSIRDDRPEKLEEAKDELGDVLWYWTNLCRELNASPEEIAQDNLDKLLDRKERGKLQGSGDNR